MEPEGLSVVKSDLGPGMRPKRLPAHSRIEPWLQHHPCRSGDAHRDTEDVSTRPHGMVNGSGRCCETPVLRGCRRAAEDRCGTRAESPPIAEMMHAVPHLAGRGEVGVLMGLGAPVRRCHGRRAGRAGSGTSRPSVA